MWSALLTLLDSHAPPALLLIREITGWNFCLNNVKVHDQIHILSFIITLSTSDSLLKKKKAKKRCELFLAPASTRRKGERHTRGSHRNVRGAGLASDGTARASSVVALEFGNVHFCLTGNQNPPGLYPTWRKATHCALTPPPPDGKPACLAASLFSQCEAPVFLSREVPTHFHARPPPRSQLWLPPHTQEDLKNSVRGPSASIGDDNVYR